MQVSVHANGGKVVAKTAQDYLCDRQHPIERPEPVAMHDLFDVGIGGASRLEHAGNALQVVDCVQVVGGLFGAVAAVEIGADCGMVGVAGNLADLGSGDATSKLKAWFAWLHDAYLPESTIIGVMNREVMIELTEDQIKRRRWDMPSETGYVRS